MRYDAASVDSLIYAFTAHARLRRRHLRYAARARRPPVPFMPAFTLDICHACLYTLYVRHYAMMR